MQIHGAGMRRKVSDVHVQQSDNRSTDGGGKMKGAMDI